MSNDKINDIINDKIKQGIWARRLELQETNRIEYKRELNDRLERTVVSFLNYPGGGEVLIGVADNGDIIGVVDLDATQLKIIDRIRKNIKPQTLGLFDVVFSEIDGKKIIRIIVSCGQQRPYYIRKLGMSEQGCFIRVGASSQPMTEQMIEELLIKRQQINLQTIVSPRQNLTFKQLCIYYEEKNLEPTEQFIENLDLRQSNSEFNYAGYLLADENGVSVKVAVYAGTDKVDLAETKEYGNKCLITATVRILDRLDSENRTFAKVTSKNRLERERVNTIALREAVINAIVHNDYTKGVPLIEIFPDRIAITSCGGLVEGLTEYDFFKCRSMPRNRELMRVFRDMELVEQIGSGMSRILKAYDKSIFELTPSFTVVTFPFAKGFESSSNRKNSKTTGNMKTTMDVIKKNPAATIAHISGIIGKSQSTVSRELKEYQSSGIIYREGARKNGKWVIA